MQITVAICTYKRASLLKAALQSLVEIEKPDMPWELLIVDNDVEQPVDHIVKLFEDLLPIRYVLEETAGTSSARNRAINEAKAPIVLFTDDDARFDRYWLCEMANAITHHSDFDFWGGRITPIWPGTQPDWFDLGWCPLLADTIVRYNAGEVSRQWDEHGDLPFYTCNLAMRVKAVKKAGMFDTTLGHCKDRRLGAEDVWMIKSIAKRGGRGWYVAQANVYHPVPSERLTKSYARQYAWRQGQVCVDFLRRESRGRVPRWLYPMSVRKALAGVGQFAIGLVRFDRGRAFAGQLHLLFNFSKFCHALALPGAKG
jgi:glycosyltransferase involved in cell wall biosynthesis